MSRTLQAAERLQRGVAAGATVLFFAIALYVGYETWDNILFFKKRWAAQYQRHQADLESARAAWNSRREALLKRAAEQRNLLDREGQQQVNAAQQALDRQLDELDAALEADLARLRQEQDKAEAQCREQDRQRVRARREAQAQALAVDEKALGAAEAELGRVSLKYQEDLDRLRSLETERDQHDRNELRRRREELVALEGAAVANGWDQGPDGRYHPPERPWYDVLTTLWEKWQNLAANLDKAYALTREAEVRQNDLRKRVDGVRQAVAARQKDLVAWAGRVDEKRGQLKAQRERLENELAAYERQFDDAARTARIRTEEDLLQQTRSLRATGEDRKRSLRDEVHRQVTRLRDEEQRQAASARAALERELLSLEQQRGQALAALQSVYESRIKPWQKSEHLRRLVGALHGMVALYALVLSLRSLVRWLQLKGWCSEPHLVRPA
jgi:hypothetical protein